MRDSGLKCWTVGKYANVAGYSESCKVPSREFYSCAGPAQQTKHDHTHLKWNKYILGKWKFWVTVPSYQVQPLGHFILFPLHALYIIQHLWNIFTFYFAFIWGCLRKHIGTTSNQQLKTSHHPKLSWMIFLKLWTFSDCLGESTSENIHIQ